MQAVRVLKQLVKEYQQERYGPPAADRARAEAREMVRGVGLQGSPDERYWYLWALCALMNQEPFYREWKKRKLTREERQIKLAARAKALASVMKQREVNDESDVGEKLQRRTDSAVEKRNRKRIRQA